MIVSLAGMGLNPSLPTITGGMWPFPNEVIECQLGEGCMHLKGRKPPLFGGNKEDR